MLIDITTRITPEMIADAQKLENKALAGHLGTHFDAMNKEFPLTYTRRKGIIFDVSDVKGRDIAISDIDMDKISQDMFVAFYTGFIEEEPYGSMVYFSQHPQLADELIDALVAKKISIIGLDCAGIRRGKEHTPKDQYCADHGVFVVENLCHLKNIVDAGGVFTANTYPMHITHLTGLPCRVIVEV